MITRAGQLPDATAERPGALEEISPSERSRARPSRRYVLPSFVERTSYGVKESNPYNKLFEERIIFLGVQIDDASANDVMAQLLVPGVGRPGPRDQHVHQLAGRVVHLADGDLRHDAVRPARTSRPSASARPRRRRPCCSRPARPGKRLAVPNARILIHQPATEGVYGQVSDLEIQAAEIQRMRRLLETTLARHTGQHGRAGPRATSSGTRSSRPRRPRSTGSSTRSSRAGSSRAVRPDRPARHAADRAASAAPGGDRPADPSAGISSAASVLRPGTASSGYRPARRAPAHQPAQRRRGLRSAAHGTHR